MYLFAPIYICLQLSPVGHRSEEIKPTHFVRSNVVAKCSLVRVFLKVVPGSVKHNTAVDSVTKVPKSVVRNSKV